MTKEEKELLLKDISVRVPYGVKYLRYSWNYDTDQELPVIETLECADKDGYINHTRVYTVGDIKPYLFPMSSMTEEQREELFTVVLDEQVSISDCSFNDMTGYSEILTRYIMDAIDWLNAHHFDYRELIEKGLALDATGLNIY